MTTQATRDAVAMERDDQEALGPMAGSAPGLSGDALWARFGEALAQIAASPTLSKALVGRRDERGRFISKAQALARLQSVREAKQ